MTENHASRRAELADAAADIVLAEGVAALGLRALAPRLGTSARMLLYYFETREALVLAVMARISERLRILLAEFEGVERRDIGAFAARVLALASAPTVAPFMRVWTEIIARGARGEDPYRAIAAEAVAAWLAWIEQRLVPEEGGASDGSRAATILAIVEGATLLELARPGTTSGVAEILAARLR